MNNELKSTFQVRRRCPKIKTVRDIIGDIHKHGGNTFHKSLGNNVEVLPDDWFRIYRGGDCIIEEKIFTCDWSDIDSIPEDVLNTNVDMYNTWLIGGNLSCDCIILSDLRKLEYIGTDKEKLLV